jgi:hypothetical protein
MQLKGVVDFADDISPGAKVYAEVPAAGIALTLERFNVYSPATVSSSAAMPANLTDKYQPCILHPFLAPGAVYEITTPGATSDTLNVELCSPGGYDQVGISFLHPHTPRYIHVCVQNAWTRRCMSGCMCMCLSWASL